MVPAGKGLTSWFSFVMSNCDVFTFPLVSWVRCGDGLCRFLHYILSNQLKLMLRTVDNECELIRRQVLLMTRNSSLKLVSYIRVSLFLCLFVCFHARIQSRGQGSDPPPGGKSHQHLAPSSAHHRNAIAMAFCCI